MVPAAFPKGLLKKECQMCGQPTAFQSHKILKDRGYMLCRKCQKWWKADEAKIKISFSVPLSSIVKNGYKLSAKEILKNERQAKRRA